MDEYYKCKIAFSLPFSLGNSKQNPSTVKQLTYVYNVRFHVASKFKVQIIINEVTLAGNLTFLGLPLSKTIKDSIYVEEFRGMQPSNSTNAKRIRTLVYDNYKQADTYLKNCLKQLVFVAFNKPLTNPGNLQAEK